MRRSSLVASLLVTLVTNVSAHAADVDLYGKVKDAGSGDVIAGAKVTVFKQSTDQSWKELVTTRTNATGVYEIPKIPVGKTRLIFDKLLYKAEEVITTLVTPPPRRELPMTMIQVTADASYFKKVGESKAAWINLYVENAGTEDAAALYRWQWYSCVIGLSATQTKLCAEGLYGNVSPKIPKPIGVKTFATVDRNALAAVDQKLGEGAAPSLVELQQSGIPPEVAWFTKWQQLQKTGASAEEIDYTRKTLSASWKLPPDKTVWSNSEVRYYPTVSLPFK